MAIGVLVIALVFEAFALRSAVRTPIRNAALEFDPALTSAPLVEAIDASERRVRATTGVAAAKIYVQPDIGTRESLTEAAPRRSRDTGPNGGRASRQ